jgi:hypothetical protein
MSILTSTPQTPAQAASQGSSQAPSQGAEPGRGGRGAAALRQVPFRVLGAVLLVGALDPARWPDYLCPQWFFGAIAAAAGLWAGVPVVRRPVLDSHRWRDQLSRHRNTLLAAAAALLAGFQSPPVWLMVVQAALLLGYLALVDAASTAARTPGARAGQALAAAAGTALVLLAALAPVTGGSWARLVAGAAVFGALGLAYAALRLRRPAAYVPVGLRDTSARPDGTARRH